MNSATSISSVKLGTRYSHSMNPTNRRRCAIVSAALVLVGVAAIEITRAQEQTKKKYPYPEVRDMRGVVPPGPKVAPYNSPPLGDGPFNFETYEQRHIRVVAHVNRHAERLGPRVRDPRVPPAKVWRVDHRSPVEINEARNRHSGAYQARRSADPERSGKSSGGCRGVDHRRELLDRWRLDGEVIILPPPLIATFSP